MMAPVIIFLALLAVPTAARENSREWLEGEVSGFTAEQAEYLVHLHNQYRSAEDATAMIKLEWDDEIAAVAQSLADKCKLEHMSYQDRLEVGQYGGVGENLFAQPSRTITGFSIRTIVDLWAEEKEYYRFSRNSCKSGEDCSHYTQVVWDSARVIGCGVKKCSELKGWGPPGFIVFCQYGPPGNNGNRPYTSGTKCSECPDFAPTCDAEYSLCSIGDGSSSSDSGSNSNPPTDDDSDDNSALECEDGWTEIEGRCFKYYSRNIPFDEAVVACAQDDAVIAMPKTDAIVQGLLELKTDRWIWINVVEQPPTWYDGTPLSWTNWRDGQDEARCVYIRLETELWYYRDCTRNRKFFCEKDPSVRRRRALREDKVAEI